MSTSQESVSPRPKPDYIQQMETAYGAPSQNAFGSVVFYETLPTSEDLEQASLAKYKYFIGELWERYGEEAWMAPWKKVYERPGDAKADVVAELRGIKDMDASISVPMILENIENPEGARKALSAAFDDPDVVKFNVYNLGDGAAMSGLLVAGQRNTGETTFLVFLLD